MKHIQLWENQTAFDAGTKYYPNVSFIQSGGTMVMELQNPDIKKILYKTSGGTVVDISVLSGWTNSGAQNEIVSNTYENGIGTIVFDGVVKNIPNNAFRYKAITEICLPPELNEIGQWSFHYTKLVSVVIPDSVTTIRGYSFNTISTLRYITLGNGITTMENDSFISLNSSISITFNGTKAEFYNKIINISEFWLNNGLSPNMVHCSDGDFQLFAIVDNIFKYYYNGVCLASSAMPSSVTINATATLLQGNVATTCFKGQFQGNNVVSITLPEGLLTIGDRIFPNSNTLTSITIPSTVTLVDYWTLDNAALDTVICLPTTPPVNRYNFVNSNHIYVPAGSVDLYKATWTNLADKIEAIS